MKRLTIVIVSSFLVAACDCGPPIDAGGDGAVMDGSVLLPDGTPPFDPTQTYPGEGDACQFSVQCGVRQICVDDRCVRHERVSVDELELGAPRRLTASSLAQTVIETEAAIPWSDFKSEPSNLNAKATMFSTIWSDGDGPQLVAIPFDSHHCQVIVAGSRVRVLSIDDLSCFAAALESDGRIAIAGVRPTTGENIVTLFDRNDAVVWQKSIPSAVNAELSQISNWGAGAVVGHITSLHFDGNDLYASFRRGVTTTNTYQNLTMHTVFSPLNSTLDLGMGFLRIDQSGSMQLLRRPDGTAVHEGRRGWLMNVNGHMTAVMLRQTGMWSDTERVFFVRLDTDEEKMLNVDYAWDGLFAHLGNGHYRIQLDRNNCLTSVFDEAGEFQNSRALSAFCVMMHPLTRRGDESSLDIPVPVWWYSTDSPLANLIQYYGTNIDGYLVERAMYGDGASTLETVTPGNEATPIGAAGVARFGKTLEYVLFDTSPQTTETMIWIEWSLRRREPDAGMP